MSESVDWMDLVQNRYKWNPIAKLWWIFGFLDILSFIEDRISYYLIRTLQYIRDFQNYDAVNMLVAVSRPRLVLCLRWTYAASYNECPLFQEFRIWSSTLFSPHHILVIASFLRWNILLSILFSDTRYCMFFTYCDRPNCTRIKPVK
jgi:hypothetical protein